MTLKDDENYNKNCLEAVTALLIFTTNQFGLYYPYIGITMWTLKTVFSKIFPFGFARVASYIRQLHITI